MTETHTCYYCGRVYKTEIDVWVCHDRCQEEYLFPLGTPYPVEDEPEEGR